MLREKERERGQSMCENAHETLRNKERASRKNVGVCGIWGGGERERERFYKYIMLRCIQLKHIREKMRG